MPRDALDKDTTMSTTRNRTLLIVVAAVIVVVGIISAVTATLMHNSADNAPSGSDAEFGIDPIPTEPNDVAVHVMSRLYTWQPAIEDSSWDALHSQQQYLSGTLAQAAAQPPNPAPQPLPDWAAWARSRDTITAVVHLDGTPTVSDSTAVVPIVITQTVQHSNRESTPYATYTATVDLENNSGTWTVSSYRLENSTS